jgi:hypothetical protein
MWTCSVWNKKEAKKIRQQQRDLVSLLAESRLKENDGLHNTSVRIKSLEIWTVPIWVTAANCPLGNLTWVDTTIVIVVRKEIEPTIWSVALVSMIHGLWSWEWLDATWKIWEWITEKTECEKSKLFEEKLWIPDIVEKMLSWLTELLPTWRADAWLSGLEGFSNAKSCSHCVWVKDNEGAWRWDWILWLF